MFKKIILLFVISSSVLLSNDWRRVKDSVARYVDEVQKIDSTNCLAIAQHTSFAEIFKTTDQGRSWHSIYKAPGKDEYPPFLVNVESFQYTDKNHVYILFSDNYIIKKSTDGGKTFKNIKINDQRNIIASFFMMDSAKGFCYTPESFYVTFDGWETFEQKYVKKLFVYSPVKMDSANIQMIRMDEHARHVDLVNYNIYKHQWTQLHEFKKKEGESYHDGIQDVVYVNDSIGFGVGDRNYAANNYAYDIIYKTTDRGNSWKRIVNNFKDPKFGLQESAFYDKSNGVVVGMYGKIMMTNNGGESWKYVDTTGLYPDHIRTPNMMHIVWLGKTPVIGTSGGSFYRYEGDFFDFPGGIYVRPDLIYPKDSSIVDKTEIEFQWKHSSDTLNFIYQLASDRDLKDMLIEHTTAKNVSGFKYQGLKKDEQYFWRVAATDGKDTTWSHTYTFATGLKTPYPVKPECGKRDLPRNVNVEWYAVLGAEAYQFKGATDSSFSKNVINMDYFDDSQLVLKGLDSNKKYFWKVRAFNDSVTTEWSRTCNFRVGDIDTAQLIYPEDKSKSHNLSINFKWGGISHSDNYTISISEDEEMEAIVREKDTKKTQMIIDSLEYFTNYFWQIKTHFQDDKTQTPIYEFRTRMKEIETVSPECGVDSTQRDPMLEWSSVKGAAYHKLEVAKDKYFTDIVLQKDSISENKYQLPALDSTTTYYWRVMGYNSGEEGDWTEACSFKTGVISSVRDYLTPEFTLRPNPAQDYIKISTGGEVLSGEIIILNSLGVAVKTVDAINSGKIDVSGLSPGIYFVRIGERVEKFVKW